MLDYKITKKHYPRTNSNSVLEFIFEKDPNLFLKKNKILIRGTIEISSILVSKLLCDFYDRDDSPVYDHDDSSVYDRAY